MTQARSGRMLYEIPPHAAKPINGWIVLAVIVPALLVSHVLAAGWGLQDGFQRGRAHQKQVTDDTPKAAPANCKELARICANQEIDRFKRFGRKPT
jgi:hypothetical protein